MLFDYFAMLNTKACSLYRSFTRDRHLHVSDARHVNMWLICSLCGVLLCTLFQHVMGCENS